MINKTGSSVACALLLVAALVACSGGAAPGATRAQPMAGSPAPSVVFVDAARTFLPSPDPSPTRASPTPATTLTPSVAAGATVPPVLEPTEDPDAHPFEQEIIGIPASVPANGHVDVPVRFEGSAKGAVAVMVDDDRVTARFGKTPLERGGSGPLAGLGTAILTSPRDGPLRISNSGPRPVDVAVMVTILSDRHLVVQTVLFAPAGAAIDVRVSLTEPLPGDVPTAQLVDATGAQTPIALAPDGPGRWKAVIRPATAGQSWIRAAVKGLRPRVGGTQFQVGAEGAGIDPAVAESTVDDDGNGRIDRLVLTPTVTVTKAGNYTLVSTLLDRTGKVIDHGRATATLRAGAPTAMPVEFSGGTIHDAGQPGPYRLTGLILIAESLDWLATLDDAGMTAAYPLGVFEP